MPTIIAGQLTDLTKTVAKLVKELIQNNWPIAAYSPLKSEIRFGLGTFDGYRDIHIHVNPAEGESEPDCLGWSYYKVTDPVTINVFVRKNTEEIPDSLGNVQRKIEEIIRENVGNLGQGITAIKWNRWGDAFQDDSLEDVWRISGYASAIYWRVKT
jgi:hypothetical protein